MKDDTIAKKYFDDIYSVSDDPWNFTESSYEQEKYNHTIIALNGKQFNRGLEIGCSIGVLTNLLAAHCSALVGVDISEKPIAIARAHMADRKNVQFEVLDIPRNYPDGKFDLIVVSEVAYYLTREDLALTKELIMDSLTEGGTLCLVHWRPQIEGCVFNGDEVNEYFLNDHTLTQTYQQMNEKYRIDVIEKQAASPQTDLHRQ